MKRSGQTALALALLCGGCGGDTEGDGSGGVSPGEAQALNDAAAMLDARSGAPVADPPPINPAAAAARKAERPSGRTSDRPRALE